MNDNIKLFKLVTSEEIVTRIADETDDYYLLEKPRLCTISQRQDKQGNVGNFLVLLPWMMYATDPENKIEKDVKLYKSVIAGEADGTPNAIEKEYLSVISTIQLVT